jgi:hypothetical protein
MSGDPDPTRRPSPGDDEALGLDEFAAPGWREFQAARRRFLDRVRPDDRGGDADEHRPGEVPPAAVAR